ncbi:MAG: HAD family hydrolase [Chloroflexi bacterium]|nr:HAD family hydrolase [Chloroflexota bacterium]
MKEHKKITAVLFDWDLTLAYVVGIETYSERLQAIFRAGGLDFALTDIEIAMRNHQIDTATLKLPILPGVPQTQKDITDYYREILSRLGYVNDDDAFFDRLYDIFAELPLALYPTALSSLQQLRKQGITLGVITNHSRLIRPVIEKYAGAYFPPQHVIISQELQIDKPSPSIFRHAAAQLQVDPANCMFVGDNLFVDAIGAVEHGGYARGLWIDRKNTVTKRPPPENVYRITSLSQTLDFV